TNRFCRYNIEVDMKNKTIRNCIYQIKSRVSGAIYIGSAVNFTDRRSKHLRDLERNQHHNSRLQNHYNKYGPDCLEFKILKLSTREDIIKHEQLFIDTL